MRLKQMKKIVLLCGMVGGMFLGLAQETASLTVCAEEYEYDELNRVVKVLYEDGSYVEYSYDSNGNIVKTTVHSTASDADGESDKRQEPGDDENSGNSEDSGNDGGPGSNEGSDDDVEDSDAPSDFEEPDITEKDASFGADVLNKLVAEIKDLINTITQWITNWVKRVIDFLTGF